MRAGIIVLAALTLTAVSVSGCADSGITCGTSDTTPMTNAVGGSPTPRDALRAAIKHTRGLPADGWKLSGRFSGGDTFTAGPDSVDVLKTKYGRWVTGSETVCRQ